MTSSTLFCRKRTGKDSSDSAKLTFDLLSNLTYMSAMAISETTRDKIFEHAITQAYDTSFYFKRVYLLVKRLGFEYAGAFQLVAKKTASERVKSLLLRFASSMNSGESELGFLATEARVQGETYTSEYNRKVDSLQKWGDAYAAMLVSVSVIIVIAMVSTMIYDMGSAFVVILSMTTIVLTAFGAYVIHTQAPVELTTYKGRRGPWLRRRAVFCLIVFLARSARWRPSILGALMA